MTESDPARTVQGEETFSDMMLESMPGIVYFYDSNLRFLRWNRNLERVSGYSGEQIPRMHPLDFFRPEDRPFVEARIADVFARGESTVEAPLLARDGTVTPYFFTGRRVLYEGNTCLVGVGIDISDRLRALHLLGESERKYRELVEYANSIILRWNPQGLVTFINAYGQKFFGYSAEEMRGRHVMETIVPPSDTGGRDLRRLMEQILADPASFEQGINENIRRNGERVLIAWTNRIVYGPDGEVVEILSIGSDITAQRQAEEEREKRRRAESADRIKSAFLATMSHELRTPLNSIIGFTGIILQGLAGPLNGEQHKQLDMVLGSARHLLALVNDVLDLSKIEAGQLEVERRRFALRGSLDRVLGIIAPQASAKQLTVRTNLAPDLGEATGDERRFQQILLNLLSNAVKFTERGEVTLSAQLVAGPAVRVDVSDTGIGMKPEDLPRLFQPFSQIDTGLARQHEGSGLGLAICRRLVEAMGGDISVRSEWQRGSTFTVTVPLNVPEKR